MSKPKGVNIKLTAKQRAQIHRLTGEEHDEVRFEAVPTPRSEMATKSAPARRVAPRFVSKKLTGRLSLKRLATRSVGRATGHLK